MIAADRNMLKASLTRGILEIQLNLVNLYTSNLNAIATQVALVVGFSFTGIAEITHPGQGWFLLRWVTFTFLTHFLISHC